MVSLHIETARFKSPGHKNELCFFRNTLVTKGILCIAALVLIFGVSGLKQCRQCEDSHFKDIAIAVHGHSSDRGHLVKWSGCTDIWCLGSTPVEQIGLEGGCVRLVCPPRLLVS